MIAPLLFAVALVAPAGAEPIGSEMGMCPDGSLIEREMYDPDPADPNAVIVIFKRGDQAIALLDSRNMQITLASGQKLDLVEAKRRYPTPCDLPSSGTGM